MTQDEIIRLAKRAVRLSVSDDNMLSSFVKSAEKNIVDDLDFICCLVRLAQAEEREACAKVCDEKKHFFGYQCAEAIRARGNK